MPSDFIVQVGHSQIQLLKGDITSIALYDIVNAANSQLAGGGGVDGAIHRAGGPEIMAELDVIRYRVRQCEPGNAVVTGAGRLPAKYIFHAVGPIYHGGHHGEAKTLKSSYTTCFKLAVEYELKTISFPSISSGVYGYPIDEGAKIALQTAADWLREHNGPVRTVKLVQFSDRDHEIYKKHAQRLREDLARTAHG